MDPSTAGARAAASSCSNPGAHVLDLLRNGPVGDRTVLYLRHSIRNSFAGVPVEQQLAAEITPEGVLRAREFGASLRQLLPGRRLVLGHTLARRCRMTAECIGAGYAPGGEFRMIDYHGDIDDLFLDVDAFLAIREEHGWEGMIERWLARQIPPTVMRDPRIYADRHLDRLLSTDGVDDGDLFIVIGHDITVFPLVSRLFDRTITTVDFLNGIVIDADGTTAGARFSDGERALATTLTIA
jgi:hypothetical protein